MLGDSLRRRRSPASGRPRRSGLRRLARRAAVVLVVAASFFAAGYAVAARVLFPPTGTDEAYVPVPELFGRDTAAARLALEESGLVLEAEEALPRPGAAPGIVLAQSPLPGQMLRPGGVVRVAVSREAGPVRLPDLVGLPAPRAEAILSRAGLRVVLREVWAPEQPGLVLGMDPAPGIVLEPPAPVVLVVGLGPAPADSALVLPGDTLPAGPAGAGPGGPAPGAEAGTPPPDTAAGPRPGGRP